MGHITQLLDQLGTASVSIPADRVATAVRADAEAAITHLQAGGRWTRWGVWTPKVVKERTYLRDEVTVDGRLADTPERLQMVCLHLDLRCALEALERAWADHGGLPAGADLRVRLAAIQELVDSLDEALAYARACLEIGRGLGGGQHLACLTVREIMPGEPWPSDISDHMHAAEHADQPDAGDDPSGGDGTWLPQVLPLARNLPLATYAAYEGPTGEDPRTVGAGAVADGLCRIIAVEGLMVAKRAYDVYLEGCGIKRMGQELKRTLNKALAEAIRQGRVLSEDERGKRGLLFFVVRAKEGPPIRLRTRGPRTFEEIPPSEVQAVATCLVKRCHLTPGSEEHLRAVLECFELKRLTAPLGATLREILGKRYPYVDDFLRDVGELP